MLKRIIFVLTLAMAMPVVAPAFASPISDRAVSQLRKQGYDDIRVRRTLLGRIRITASSDTYQREIVVHPITGEVMRDRWSSIDGSASGSKPKAIHPERNGGDRDDDGHGENDDGDGENDDGDGDNDGGDSDGGDSDGGDGHGDGGESDND